ncbi:MAG: MerR family DNA-binding transcriptional regulator [Chloroflexi bacterium]|nr:MerR family DNA-binding transcriptional regulator [Chloroflexota bacterium]
METPQWLSLGQAARLLGVAPSTLRYWSDQGIIRCFRTPGGHRRFTYEDVRELRQNIAAGLVPQAALPPVEHAISSTRQALTAQSISAAAWYQRLSEEARQKQRHYGRQLLTYAVQYLARRNGNGGVLKQATAIAYEQGRMCAQHDLNAAETIEAFWFCCRTIEAVLVPMDPEQAPVDAEHLRLHQELTDYFHILMRAVLLGYEDERVLSA